MTRGRTVTNFKQAQALVARRRARRIPAVFLAFATAFAAMVSPLLALGVVGLMLWQAFSPD